MAARADSPSRRGAKLQVVPSTVKSDDLEELDEDEDGEEMVQEDETAVDDADLPETAGPVPQLWTMDWGDLDQERRNFRKRPALDDLPDEVREELASMSGAETEIRPKQKLKLEPADTMKESSRGRKSPADEVGTADLLNLLTKPAKTAEERLVVLEARDKLVRIRSDQQRCPQRKNVGKCPDMCSEKERYQRIARHQVDYYEYNRETKDVNQASMVKIYARSSADQQMPLPHDLRPVNVLWMTMSYLASRFMDLADSPGENLGEWYHFLWDRMRSIRKDITQLALCDTISVQILEMCARFHIFCMERLREEKMAVFDEKINRENLTKCLQSLQYMYNDLFLKNVSCPNEPEFQAYSILLHINSDLCTSTILGLRSEMRQHEKVKFAINAFLAVTMKNYVRFFKLVKSTTYLNACILHQYFAQVRAHAMHSILRAYSRQKMRNTYPLSELKGQLLFDSNNDVLEFCKFSKVPVEENNVVLEKHTAHPIPMQEKMKRSFVGVECKRQSSIREIVAGGCLLANTALYHKVHDSFDEQGILKQEAWYAEDQDGLVLSVRDQDIETSPAISTASPSSHSSMHANLDSRGSSPLQDFSSLPALPFGTRQPSASTIQSSGVAMPPQSVFNMTKANTSLTEQTLVTHTVAEKNVCSVNVPTVVAVAPEMSARSFEHQKNTSDVVTSKAVSSHSASGVGHTLADAKSFVFRLSSTKPERMDDQQRENTATASLWPRLPLRTAPSIVGGSSGTIDSQSSGSSILRMPSGHTVFTTQQTVQSTSSEYWSSPPLPLPPVISSHNSGNIFSPMATSTSDMPVNSQSKSPTFSFSTTSSSGTLYLPGISVPSSIGFWESKFANSSPESTASFISTTSSVDSGLVLTSSGPSQFPVSVYGLPSQSLSESTDAIQTDEQVTSVTSTQVSVSHTLHNFSSPYTSQNLSNSSHKSPLLALSKAVTAPTSLYSRPLTTPQMFSKSVSPPSVSVSVFPNIPCPASCVANTESNSYIKTSVGDGFSFSLGETASSLSFTTSHPASTSAPSCQISVVENAPATEKLFSEAMRESVDTEKHDSPFHTQKVDSDKQIQISEQAKTRSPVAKVLPTLLPSPSHASELKKRPASIISGPSRQKFDENKKKQIYELVREVFKQWRLLAYRAKLKRRLQSQKISAPVGTTLSLEEQVCELPIPEGCVAVDFRTRIEYLLDVEDIKDSQPIIPDIGELKIENVLGSVLPKELAEMGKYESNMFWKLYISLPGESEGKKFSLQLCKWTDATFSDSANHKTEKEILRATRTQLGEEYNLFTSVQRTIGSVKDALQGVSGILFFTPRSITNIESTFDRYQKLVDALPAHFPLPLVAVVSNIQWIDVCRTWCISDIQKGRLAAFKIIIPFQQRKEIVLRSITDSILWLTQYIRPAPPLERWPLREVLLTVMTDLWTHVRFSLASRCSFGWQQHPQDLLGLYHDALKYLLDIVANDQLCQYGDIPVELESLANKALGGKYISRMILQDALYMKEIKKGFSHLQLNIQVPSTDILSVETFCEAVCSYNCRLRGPVSHFLCQWNDIGNVDWTRVVEAVAEMHIRDTIGEFKLKKLILVFVKNEIQKFRMEPWYTLWLQDRLADQEFTLEESLSDNNLNRDGFELDSSQNCSDLDASELNDSDDKLLSDFESMLSELEKMNKVGLQSKNSANFNTLFQSFDSADKTNGIELDIFETQLQKYEELLKD